MPNDFANRPAALVAIRDAGVWYPLSMEAQHIFVLGEGHSLLLQGECELLFVGRPEKVGLRGGGHVDATEPETLCDGRVDVLVKMKPDHLRRPRC